MYYPMRVVRERRYKLIWNLAHPLPYPFASDLWEAPTWQTQYRQGMDALYGKRTVGQYLHRPEFELYDLESDPHEVHNLAHDAAHADDVGPPAGQAEGLSTADEGPLDPQMGLRIIPRRSPPAHRTVDDGSIGQSAGRPQVGCVSGGQVDGCLLLGPDAIHNVLRAEFRRGLGE